jgi:hypothetical protein
MPRFGDAEISPAALDDLVTYIAALRQHRAPSARRPAPAPG